jgi:hypothetical protein
MRRREMALLLCLSLGCGLPSVGMDSSVEPDAERPMDSGGFGDSGPARDSGFLDAGNGDSGATRDADSSDGATIDAGCSDVGGCFTLPEFDDCSCRCPGGVAGTAGKQNAAPDRYGCSLACACGVVNRDAGTSGSEDYSFGCSNDSDCWLTPADCCGCTAGGLSIAIASSHYGSWFSALKSICAVRTAKTPCWEFFECAQARAACKYGRCIIANGQDGGS